MWQTPMSKLMLLRLAISASYGAELRETGETLTRELEAVKAELTQLKEQGAG